MASARVVLLGLLATSLIVYVNSLDIKANEIGRAGRRLKETRKTTQNRWMLLDLE